MSTSTNTVIQLIARLRSDRADALATVRKIDVVLESLAALYPEHFRPATFAGGSTPSAGPASVPTSDEAIPTRNAALRVLSASDGWLVVSDIAERAAGLGWRIPAGSDAESIMRTALGRLARAGEIDRRRHDGRRFEYRARSTNAEAPAATGASGSVTAIPEIGGGGNGTGTHRDHDPHQGHRDHPGGAPSVEGSPT